MADQRPNSDLDSLQKRIEKARDSGGFSQSQKNSDPDPSKRGLALAFRVGIELVSAVVVGVAIGWALDTWLGTTPWMMLAFFLLGGCAGMLNVYRLARGYGYAAGYRPDNGPDTGQDNGTESDTEHRT